jgi:pyruvate,orthophosphate dikinase
MQEPALSGEFATLMGWADEVRKLKVRANADTPNDARVAMRFGAEGIGLCRTEHMGRIRAVREMILADDEKTRRAALAKLLPMQRDDFIALFEIMGGLPVTIRLLDPPLHEFLPHTEAEIAEVATAMNATRIDDTARAVAGERGTRIDYQLGTMIELPRAALMAGDIAETAEYLTQTAFGISRDDAASFLGAFSRPTRSSRSTATASANWCRSRPRAAAKCANAELEVRAADRRLGRHP